jgi:hypothetical protein
MDADTGKIMASGTVVMVTFDYKDLKTIPVPDEWKKKISEFEGLLTQGSAINFVIRDKSIKFEMDMSNARDKGLKVDPRIRELAVKVVE